MLTVIESLLVAIFNPTTLSRFKIVSYLAFNWSSGAYVFIDGIKIHMLHIIKNTDLEDLYKKQSFHILTKEEYVDIVINQLEVLNENMVNLLWQEIQVMVMLKLLI